MKSNELRQAFLDYFQQHHHTVVASSLLVPADDPTLLFTNAGMVQFKDVFLGKEMRPYQRAVSAQRCVRAGGKHNDLENVGYTARHHTFFEMLGNFSFGDYFKREAITFAWQFLTEVLKIPAEKLWVTVFEDDQEAADIWLKEMKISPLRFSYCGEKDNFWSMGDTGPCGPCSEVFYDHGEGIPGGPPGSSEADGDRYVEIWNLVFMQFNRLADGKLTPLPKPSVDTGMGLERVAAVLQGVHTNYDIDLFRHLIQSIATLASVEDDISHPSLRVIADHIRSCAFLITDGVRPSNEGRGYVLRRIIRRAIRHGHKLGLREPFFYRLIAPLVVEMGEAYPELVQAKFIIEKVLQQEEHQFAHTLEQGMRLLEQTLNTLNTKTIPGLVVFQLYDTYGFPPDLTGDIARERGLNLDYAGFEAAMAKQRQQSQAASQFGIEQEGNSFIIPGETEFTGYQQLSSEAVVVALVKQNQLVKEILPGVDGVVILDRTPFYAESGGQIGDKGKLFFEKGIFQVIDTQKRGGVYWHYGKLESGRLVIGTKVSAEVDAVRHSIMANHSATHLLHAALRRILGEHVIQKGSLVEADRLRFDFSHFTGVALPQIKAIEQLVNQQIRANLPCRIHFMKANEAKKSGAMALFEEKYGDEVRVLSMGEFSVELCGGTHVAQTGDIGAFKIIAETGVAAGVRRIEAVTGQAVLDWIDHVDQVVTEMAVLLKVTRDEISTKLPQLLEQVKQQEKQIRQLRQQQMSSQIDIWLAQAKVIQDISVLSLLIPEADVEMLRQLVDTFKQKLSRAIIVLAAVAEGKISLIGGVTKNITDKMKAGEVVNLVAQKVGGKGGGRSELAQGGGDRLEDLEAALAAVPVWVEQQLNISSHAPLGE